MVERLVQVDGGLLAVLSNGELWSRKRGGSSWERLLPEIPSVKDVAAFK
jgi:hypothetical protein